MIRRSQIFRRFLIYLLMNYFLKTYIIHISKAINSVLLFHILLIINSCNCNNRPGVKYHSHQQDNIDNFSTLPNEIIVFLGNPGVGKSMLCNSIFQKPVFNSGTSLGKGLTTKKQEYIHENRLYIDTPGLDDVVMREQAAKQIEEALKHNNNYKIVFVAMLDQGRIRPADLVTINIVCDTIKADFEYGIVFNQISKKIIRQINEERLEQYLTILHKKPSRTIVLQRDEDLEGEKNGYFQGSDENRQKLIKFLDDLKAKRIEADDIKEIDVRGFDKRINEMETIYKRRIAKLHKKSQKQAEEVKNLKRKQK